MLTPVALATWIAFCIPTADPALATAMVMAGSGANPTLVTDAKGQAHSPTFLHQAGKEEMFIGLAQVPASQLRAIGIPPALALNNCTNLALAWQLWSQAQIQAKAQQGDKWKAVALAFSRYREGPAAAETPYGKKVADLAQAHTPVTPARLGSRLYHEVFAAWANGQAQLLRLEHPGSLLSQSRELVSWARSGIE